MATSPVARESREEQLTRQFYEWETRGRGWKLWNEPVDIEPPFRPFLGHGFTRLRAVDDGRRPTLLSTLADRLSALFKSAASFPATRSGNDDDVEPGEARDGPVCELRVALLPDLKITKDVAEQFLLNISRMTQAVAFEVIATSQSIIVQIACGERDCRAVREQIHAYFPDSAVTEHPSYLKQVWQADVFGVSEAVDFGLSNEFMRPIRTFDKFDPDPLGGMIGAMMGLEHGESALFQVLFRSTDNPWPENILRAVSDGVEAVCRIERSDCDFNLKTERPEAIEPSVAARRSERIRTHSREHYAQKTEISLVHPILPEVQTEVVSSPPAPRGETPPLSDAVPSREPPPKVPLPGRGGAQHKYLQQLIKRWAEDRGYRVIIEKPKPTDLASGGQPSTKTPPLRFPWMHS